MSASISDDSAGRESFDPGPGIAPCDLGLDVVTRDEELRGLFRGKRPVPQLLPEPAGRLVERDETCEIGGAVGRGDHDDVLSGHLAKPVFGTNLHHANLVRPQK